MINDVPSSPSAMSWVCPRSTLETCPVNRITIDRFDATQFRAFQLVQLIDHTGPSISPLRPIVPLSTPNLVQSRRVAWLVYVTQRKQV